MIRIAKYILYFLQKNFLSYRLPSTDMGWRLRVADLRWQTQGDRLRVGDPGGTYDEGPRVADLEWLTAISGGR